MIRYRMVMSRRFCAALFLSSLQLFGCRNAEPRDARTQKVVEQGQVLLLRLPGEERQLAGKGEYEKLRRGRRLAFVYLTRTGGESFLSIIICSKDGLVSSNHEVLLPEEATSASLLRARWPDDTTVFSELHINPSLGIGVVFDLSSGAGSCFLGSNFVLGRKTKKLAYLRAPPHFAPRDIPSELWIGHAKICEIPSTVNCKLAWNETGNALQVFRGAGNKEARMLTVKVRNLDTPDVIWHTPKKNE